MLRSRLHCQPKVCGGAVKAASVRARQVVVKAFRAASIEIGVSGVPHEDHHGLVVVDAGPLAGGAKRADQRVAVLPPVEEHHALDAAGVGILPPRVEVGEVLVYAEKNAVS